MQEIQIVSAEIHISIQEGTSLVHAGRQGKAVRRLNYAEHMLLT